MTQTPKRFSDALVYGRNALAYGRVTLFIGVLRNL